MAEISFSGFIGIGGDRIPYAVTRSKRRKRSVAFGFGREGNLHVIAPAAVSQVSIERILEKRAVWIAREVLARKKEDTGALFVDGSFFPYLGYSCAVRVLQGENYLPGCFLKPGVIHVHVARDGVSAETLREEVRLEILLWLKRRARTKLRKRLDFWARRMGVSYKKFVVASAQSRWGSCSVDNVIRLSWKLMMTPLPLIDYVVAHELCHVRHKNHSVSFWRDFQRVMPDCKLRRKELREAEKRVWMVCDTPMK